MISINGLKFELYIPEAEIKQRVKAVAEQINEDYKGRQVVLLGILNGAFMFTADLVRDLTVDNEIHFTKVSSYEGTNSTGEVKELIGLTIPLEGRDVIVVEDIVDTGITMHHLLNYLKDKGAKSVEVCTLMSKPERRQVEVDIKYCAMEVPDKFILGYGLDYNNKGRNLKDIYQCIIHNA